MLKFELMDIVITVSVTSQSETFKDATCTTRHRFVKETSVNVDFWGYTRTEKDFSDLCAIKSVLQFWMNSYWKRGGKNSDLIKCREHLQYIINYNAIGLILEGCQKNGKKQLHVCCLVNGSVHDECYLDYQHVSQLDIALGKAINAIRPSETVLPAVRIS